MWILSCKWDAYIEITFRESILVSVHCHEWFFLGNSRKSMKPGCGHENYHPLASGAAGAEDLYLTHWSFRMSQPQQNWGQSLQYRQTLEKIARREGQATFEEVVGAMDKLATWRCSLGFRQRRFKSKDTIAMASRKMSCWSGMQLDVRLHIPLNKNCMLDIDVSWLWVKIWSA